MSHDVQCIYIILITSIIKWGLYTNSHSSETVQGMGVVINCMGKGKEGSQTYNLYIEIYTRLEGGEKLRNWTAQKSTSGIRISLGLTYTLMAKWQWKRIPVEGSCESNSLLASSPAVASLVCGILKVGSRSGESWRSVQLQAVTGSEMWQLFVWLALKHASSASVDNSPLFMSASHGGLGGE